MSEHIEHIEHTEHIDHIDVDPCGAADIGSWDVTTDVIVVGFGAAGSAAAFSAAEAGAEVLVIERTGGPGGAAALAEGIVYLGGGTPIQTACGFEDSLDDMYRYMMAACGPDPDEAKVARYCAGSLGHFDWLEARGVPFDPTFCADTSMAPDGTEGLVYSGGEDAYPFNEIARPAPRGHLAKTKRSTGWLLMQHLAAAATEAGAVVSADTRVDRLVVEDERVVGVQAQRFGETVSMRARRGVVLAAGGFIFNDDMLRQHCPPLARGTFKVGTEGDDGRAIRMAQALGASVRNMYAGEVSLPITPPRSLIHGILVNGKGQRFINEDTYMGRVGQSALYEQDGEVYLLVDEASYEVNWMGLAATWVCETPEQLEAEIGPARRLAPLDAGPLQRARGARRGPAVPQGSGVGAPARAAHRRVRPTHRACALCALHPRRARDDGRRRGPRRERPGHPRTFRGRPHHGRRVLVRVRQRAVDRRQHDVRAFRRRQRGGDVRLAASRPQRGVLDDPRHHGVVGLVDGTAVERGLRVVLDHELRRLSCRAVDEQLDEPECHVDAARDTRSGDDAPVQMLDDAGGARFRAVAQRAPGSRTSASWP